VLGLLVQRLVQVLGRDFDLLGMFAAPWGWWRFRFFVSSRAAPLCYVARR